MIRIGITGKGSYIGQSFKKSLQGDKFYKVIEIDTIDKDFSQYNFSDYDIIFHVAGIAHKKEKADNISLYYKINRDLTKVIADKAKNDGVKQFIFMSSMSVYGLIASSEDITIKTPCKPNTNYGKSKLEAEQFLLKLADENFKVCILRPPMVYGTNSPGNLSKLFTFVRKIHIFPEFINKRSCISISNLNSFIKECVDNRYTGIFLPQDSEYLCTYLMVQKRMAEEHVYVFFTKTFNPLIRFLIGKSTLISKVFGNLVYKK